MKKLKGLTVASATLFSSRFAGGSPVQIVMGGFLDDSFKTWSDGLILK